MSAPTFNSGVRLSQEGLDRVHAFAADCEAEGIHCHVTCGDRTAREQAKVLLAVGLNAYGATIRNAFADVPRDLDAWTSVVASLRKRGYFADDHVLDEGQEHGWNADLRTRDLDTDAKKQKFLELARKHFPQVGRITNHLHVGWRQP